MPRRCDATRLPSAHLSSPSHTPHTPLTHPPHTPHTPLTPFTHTPLHPAAPLHTEQVRAAHTAGIRVVLVHECDPTRGGCEFGSFFQTTPQDLIAGGIYARIAIAFHTGQHRAVSLCLLAREVGAVRYRMKEVLWSRGEAVVDATKRKFAKLREPKEPTQSVSALGTALSSKLKRAISATMALRSRPSASGADPATSSFSTTGPLSLSGRVGMLARTDSGGNPSSELVSPALRGGSPQLVTQLATSPEESELPPLQATLEVIRSAMSTGQCTCMMNTTHALCNAPCSVRYDALCSATYSLQVTEVRVWFSDEMRLVAGTSEMPHVKNRAGGGHVKEGAGEEGGGAGVGGQGAKV